VILNGRSFNQYALPLVVLSLVAAVLAALGALGTDIYLASTQWLVVAVYLAVLGIFAKVG
jgi:hypothetical protein